MDDTTGAATTAALACVPGAISAAERPGHFARLARLFGAAVRERRDTPGGYAFRFDADAFDELARWVALERRCCPFLRFTIELAPEDGPVWRRLAGPVGTRDFLAAELALRDDDAEPPTFTP